MATGAAARGRPTSQRADICDVQYWENRVAAAVGTTRAMTGPRARCGVLVIIGNISVQDGDLGRAVQPLPLAKEAGEAIADGSERARASLEIAQL